MSSQLLRGPGSTPRYLESTMSKTTHVTPAFLLLTLAFATAPISAQSAAHLGHVGESWGDTPENVGLLVAAQQEAEVAEAHAGYAAGSEDLARVKGHIGHVMHAIDPTSTEGGPGKGYGLIKAADGTVRHITMAGEADDASENAARHAPHVAQAATNASGWATQVMELAQAVQASNDLAEAQALAGQIHELTAAILNGVDANGDGRIGWQEGEGGIAQATQHFGFIGG